MSATATMTGPLDRADVRRGLWFVVIAVLVYSCLHVGFRLLASSVMGEDDVVDGVLVQDLRLAYEAFPRQPPLYNWVLWAVQQVVGPGVIGFLLIKYAALTATAAFLYLAAYRVMRDRLFAILSVESLALIYQISWRFHEGFTHEIGAMVAVMATVWLILRWFDEPGWGTAVALGIVAGLGLLTEPAYAVFLITLIVAGMLQRGLRARLLDWRLAISLVIAISMALPYGFWLWSEPARWAQINRPSADFLNEALGGLKDALRGPIAYLSPLLFLLPLVFPRYLRTAWADLRGRPVPGPVDACQQPADAGQQMGDGNRSLFILHAALAAYALSIFGAVVFAIRGPPVHALMPLYLASVIWLFDVARRASGEPLHVGRFSRLALAIAAIALFARLANMFVLDPVCKTCRWGIPYEGLATEMRARGFDQGTIVSIDKELAGNLRPLFAGSHIVTRRYPKFTPSRADPTRGDLAFVWNANMLESEAQQFMADMLPDGVKAASAETVSVPWHHLWRETGYRTTEWRVLVFDRSQP